ncbi:YdiU family protein [Paenibacillus sp. JX-17]|uniref:Protein nucleotidyltransferase YdiU n=1 Tax=Paenibacillus lacisoli TaxID=3064525 RepID=A0ABT9CFE7_9BACL|nr:YdiU family protein [Paenibacillus sp. JX-17]MDO7908000.1 YdiU family protein [Paenibacillus sp. JX-17]
MNNNSSTHHNEADHPEQAGWNLEATYGELPELFYTDMKPNPVREPRLVLLNEIVAEKMGLNPEALRQPKSVSILAGNTFPEGSRPLAQAYAGHQFAYFNRLGDGRAVLIGEQITPAGDRIDIQLKGSGRTPYSRGGDGRAALGPMLREYIISEAMHALGIPTTRSLAVVSTGESIMRETSLPGAILTRTAASHLRVGTFQYAAHFGGQEDLQALADYAIERHDPQLLGNTERYLKFLQEVCDRQAKLLAQWQLVGFIHGVMNTDNTTISGETIDYGPCAFMDIYHPGTVFSSIDAEGRYAYGSQPQIAAWNLSRLAESLLPLIHENEDEAVSLAEDVIAGFAEKFHQYWHAGMRAKLGMREEEEEDLPLIYDLLTLMQRHEADYTNTFLDLTFDTLDPDAALVQSVEFQQWRERWEMRLERETADREQSREWMKQHNPAVIPRNHRVEEALQSAVDKGDYSVLKKLLNVLSQPYAHLPEQLDYRSVPSVCGPYRTYCGT